MEEAAAWCERTGNVGPTTCDTFKTPCGYMNRPTLLRHINILDPLARQTSRVRHEGEHTFDDHVDA